MNIHEYQAKELLKSYGTKVLDGVVILREEDIDKIIDNFNSKIFVVKAQIHAGGRGKAGGIKIAKNSSEAKKFAKELWGKILITNQTAAGGKKVERLYIESGCDIKKEYYLSLVVDRSNCCITCIFSTEGGIDIEYVARNSPDKIHQIHFNNILGIKPFNLRQIAFKLGIIESKSIKSLDALILSLYNAMMKSDAVQIEINPLIMDSEDELIALDAKINFDDNALFKHENILKMRDLSEEDPLETRAQNNNLSYVRMDGNIGCMVNGAGLAMATMDIIQLYGAHPANFLDVGGSADKQRISEALKIIIADNNVKAILVNIFGGIMRCDIIAQGIINAAIELNLSLPLVVRLAGTNWEIGAELLSNSGLNIITAKDLADAAKKVVNLVK
jgi:succinyl-CoA synthetase beta subunit